MENKYSPINMSVGTNMFINGKLDNSLFILCLCQCKVSKLSLNVTSATVELPLNVYNLFEWEVFKGRWRIFGHLRQHSESLRKIIGNLRKWLGRFQKISLMTRQHSRSFDSEKVGRYIIEVSVRRGFTVL